MEYPKYLYHKTLEAVVVTTPEQMEALGAGWYSTPTERDNSAEAAPIISKEDLWVELDALEIKYDKRWSIDKLKAALESGE